MSMQQALGAVGFVVGAYFGYPQLGFVVGSLVGGALTPAQKVEGPRIDDQKVTVSTEGAGIPQVWGTVRLGGNVIESTDKMEVATTESQGKGGGGVESTTYKYYVNMRTLLCEAREGSSYVIRKIWKDGKLIYDVSSGISVGSALASADNPLATLILYQGQEDQLPDPTEEARYGVGNVLAYRGVVTIVMNGVECPGGRLPQFSVELCIDANIEVQQTRIMSAADDREPFQRLGGFMRADGTALHYQAGTYGNPNPRRVRTYSVSPGGVVPFGAFETSRGGAAEAPSNFIAVVGEDAFLQLYFKTAEDSLANLVTVRRVDAEAGSETDVARFVPPADTLYAYVWATYDELSGLYYLVPDRLSSMPGFLRLTGGDAQVVTKPAAGYGPVAAYDGKIYMVSADATTVTTLLDDGTPVASLPLPGFVPAVDPLTLVRADARGTYVLALGSGGGSTAGIYKLAQGAYRLISDQVRVKDSTPGLLAQTGQYRTFYADEQIAVLGPSLLSNGEYSYDLIRFGVVTPRAASVAEIVQDQCMQAGLDADHFEVDSIEEDVHGYTISNPTSARAGIQPLMSAFAIDATDEDGKVKFFYRASRTSAITIPYEDLGCVEDGSESGDPIPLTRANVTELPRSVTVSYINPDFDYQTATEVARRHVTGAEVDQNLEIAVAMTPNRAATAAQRALYDAHNDRNRRSFKVSRKYAFVSAGDVTTVEYPRGVLSDWRWVQETDTGALIEVEAVPADAALYAQTAVGGSGRIPQEVSPLPPQTRVTVMEGMPMLQDADNDAGVYVAMQAMGSSGYRGSTLLVGDDDATLVARGTVTRGATVGFSESELIGPAVGFGYVDNTTQLVVNVGSAELNSATWEALIVGGANVAALSVSYEVNGFPDALWEVFQFKTATPLGNGRYLLTGLLRGLRGTEQASYHHQLGDRFVLLDNSGLLHVSLEAGGIGSTKFYRGVSLGRSSSNVPSVTAESTGYGLRPLSPVNVGRRASSGAVVWTWNRRSRMQTNWQRGIVPLGEGSEAYEVVIYNDFFYTRIVRVIRVYAPTATYPAADLLADGYTASGPIPYRIYQLSATVGRGIPFQPNQGLL